MAAPRVVRNSLPAAPNEGRAGIACGARFWFVRARRSVIRNRVPHVIHTTMKSLKSLFVRLVLAGVTASLAAVAQPVPAGPGAAASTNAPAPAVTPLTAPPLAIEPPVGTVGAVGDPYLPAGTNVSGALMDPPAKPPVKPAAPKLPGVGVRGSVKAVDVKALTFTVAGKGKDAEHVVHVASTSRYSRDGKPSTIADVAVDDSFSGRVKKNKQGGEVLLTGTFSSGKHAEKHSEKRAAKAPAKK